MFFPVSFLIKMTNLEYIKNKFPKAISTAQILTPYLDNCNVDLNLNFSESNLTKVTSFITNDYFKYKIDPDQLCNLFEKLNIISQDYPNLKNLQITNLLLDIADLEVDLRNNFDNVTQRLKKLSDFYEQNKSN